MRRRPTAGLPSASDAGDAQRLGIEQAWLTLHVGAGTFQPVRVTNIAEHRMHAERRDPQATVDAIAATAPAGGRVIAVGTTSLRALESAAQSGGAETGAAETGSSSRRATASNVVDA